MVFLNKEEPEWSLYGRVFKGGYPSAWFKYNVNRKQARLLIWVAAIILDIDISPRASFTLFMLHVDIVYH